MVHSHIAKWAFGRARPEEVVWAIIQGKQDGVPEEVLSLIEAEFSHIKSPTEFTAYPEGCPQHPSFPAMHAAASAASLWMAVVFDLTPAQHCMVKRMDYAIAYGRTIAGVHYPTDNIAGLNMGQEVLAKLLPRHLEAKYGANRRKVMEKIARLRFDWNEYLEGECFQE
jgi:membrane-associated phospholipid phosphatase